jgi:hypothetical protein
MINGLSTFISNNFLTIFNTALIGVTILLSYQSFKFQSRTSVRESLEQLDDVEFSKEKLKPILHEFIYQPIRGSRTIVQLKYYRFGKNPASASLSRQNLFSRTFYKLNGRDGSDIPEMRLRDAIVNKLSELDEVVNVWLEDTGIFIEFDTGNSVEVRRRTEIVLQSLNDWHTTDREQFMQTFNMDSWETIEDETD